MIPTFLGIALLLIGLPLVLLGRIEALIPLLLGCTIFGGGSAVDLPALGGSSIPPIQLAIALGTARIMLPGSVPQRHAALAVESNWALLLYTITAVALAVIGPRLFQNQIAIPPLKPLTSQYLYAVERLRPTTQNLTTSIYMIGTLLCAITAYVACSGRHGAAVLVKTAVIVAWINIALGVTVALVRDTPLEGFFALFRNGNYAQLDQQLGGFVRLNALFPEPSVYATYCFGWFCFMAECWYRDVMPRRTGATALGLLAILLASTSSSAYISLAVYTLVLAVRMLLPGAARSGKLTIMMLVALAAAMAGAILFFTVPAAGGAFVDMVRSMTVGKTGSLSALQRGFWARKGLEAFTTSRGMGIGAGSFRSSSLLTAVPGSAGILGSLFALVYLARVVKPLRETTYRSAVDERTGTGAAAGWAAAMLLVPYSLTLPSCDLGTDFAIYGGAALALRASGAGRRRDMAERERHDLIASPHPRQEWTA